jgi:hypothetical protein
MSFSYLSHRKRFRIPWQAIVRPMLLASLGLHALILLFPLSSEQPTKPQTKSEEKINLTQVPPKGAAAPQTRPQPSKPLPPLATRSTLPKVTARSVVRSQTVAPTRSAASPQPAPAQPKPQPTAVDPFAAAFPQYPGVQPGSYGLPTDFEPFSQKTTDAVDRVSNWFQSQFKSKGFQAQSVEQSGRTVYQVSKDGKSKFLTLIPNPQGAGTSIVLSDQLLPDDLGGGSVVSPQEQAFYQNLAEIIQDANPNSAWHDLDNPRILPDPNAFYAAVVNEQEYLAGGISQLQPGVERKVVHVGQSPEALFAQISTMMQTAEIQVTPQGTYGGGALYQLQRDGITRYLSLVPTQDGNTAIFIWTRAPK